MTRQDIFIYEACSLGFWGSLWYRCFPKLLEKKVDRKIKRCKDSIKLIEEIKKEANEPTNAKR